MPLIKYVGDREALKVLGTPVSIRDKVNAFFGARYRTIGDVIEKGLNEDIFKNIEIKGEVMKLSSEYASIEYNIRRDNVVSVGIRNLEIDLEIERPTYITDLIRYLHNSESINDLSDRVIKSKALLELDYKRSIEKEIKDINNLFFPFLHMSYEIEYTTYDYDAGKITSQMDIELKNGIINFRITVRHTSFENNRYKNPLDHDSKIIISSIGNNTYYDVESYGRLLELYQYHIGMKFYDETVSKAANS